MKPFFAVVALLLAGATCVSAQTAPAQLSDVAKALECFDQKNLSAWKREQIEPFKGATDILIYKYSSSGRRVLLRIMFSPSESEASKAFNSFRDEFASTRNLENIQNLGDDAFSYGFENSVAMRKRNFNFYIESGTNSWSLLPEIEESEIRAFVRTEKLLIGINFARMLDKMLSNLNEACRRPERPDRY